MAISANVMNIETTESGTKVITLSLPDFCHTITVPENYIDGLPVIAAQPYGVIMVEDGAADDMPVVCMNNNKEFFSIALSDLMAADVHDTISFATEYEWPEDIEPTKYLSGLADVQITDPQNGQALIYDATSEKWVNGAAGGGGTGYTITKTTLADETITLEGTAETGYEGVLTTPITFVEGDNYLLTIGTETALLIGTDNNSIGFTEAIAYYAYIYDDDGTTSYEGSFGGATLHIKVEHLAVTITDDFKDAVNFSTPYVLEVDPLSEGTGTWADPIGLIGFDAITANNYIGKQVIIHDLMYFYPTYFSGTEEQASIVFEVVYSDGGSFASKYYGFASRK